MEYWLIIKMTNDISFTLSAILYVYDIFNYRNFMFTSMYVRTYLR